MEPTEGEETQSVCSGAIVRCIELMERFQKDYPEIWAEDIGEAEQRPLAAIAEWTGLLEFVRQRLHPAATKQMAGTSYSPPEETHDVGNTR